MARTMAPVIGPSHPATSERHRMLRNLPSEAQTAYRREMAYRETALFLGLTGVVFIASHVVDLVAGAGPGWAALAVRLVVGGALIVHAGVLRRSSRRGVRIGASISIAAMSLGYLAVVALSGGVRSPSIDLVYVLAVAMPLVSFELLPLGMLGSVIMIAGVGAIHVTGGSGPETVIPFAFGSFGALVAAWFLGRALMRARHAEERRHLEVVEALEANEGLVASLRDAAANVRTLTGLLPLCAWCRRVRSDTGYWQQLEAYVTSHSDATITHGMCPDCARRHFPDEHLEGAAPDPGAG